MNKIKRNTMRNLLTFITIVALFIVGLRLTAKEPKELTVYTSTDILYINVDSLTITSEAGYNKRFKDFTELTKELAILTSDAVKELSTIADITLIEASEEYKPSYDSFYIWTEKAQYLWEENTITLIQILD